MKAKFLTVEKCGMFCLLFFHELSTRKQKQDEIKHCIQIFAIRSRNLSASF